MSETAEIQVDTQEWQRLDKKMLLIGPARALKELAIPAIIAFIGITSRGSGSMLWLIPGTIGLVVIGWVPWFTTYFRITPTQLQLRKGLINKEQLTAPLDRIRSVDLESSLLHRALGLSKVEIGTGVDDTRIELNALAETDAQALQVLLLTKSAVNPAAAKSTSETEPSTETTTDAPPPPAEIAPPAVELAAIDWTWLRFAPFSLGRLVLLAGIFGLVAQFGDNLPLINWDNVGSGWDKVRTFALPAIIIVAFVSILIAWLVVSIGGYVVQWWELRLVRDKGSLRLTAGLLTTRSTSIEEERIRGVELIEPVLLRLVGGAELSTLATGVGTGGATKVLPPCPRAVATEVGERILDIRDPEVSEPLSVALTPHGPAALRRCLTRSQWFTIGVAVLASSATYFLSLVTWPAALGLVVVLATIGLSVGFSSYRHLGHALTPEHLVAGSGMLERRRTVLENDGVIGWVVKQSFFQRRAGLATLIATTAAGSEEVQVRDIPHDAAIALADRSTPGVLTPFLAS